ncbi:glycosyltransferase [Clostridium sp. A1-XYC3]|uniref:Glycosyltransferase n=1 Tax=Clostridium tanneri TaxID=3037988 RepID=A0ABU4JT44_9CLOT|nr:glycosyltransferase [Clostridium sp. A1-XYC3]MDW8801300.1 glycosyltransferase [Clostridium sp. A1-XYC3]
MLSKVIYSKEESIIDNDNSGFYASVIVPCKNEVDSIKWTIDSIKNSQNNLSYEIIIVDDGSTDRSCNFIDENKEAYKNIRIIRTENGGTAGARNIGAEAAEGKYLFFCDAHVKVPDYWIDNLIETLEKNDADAVAATIKVMDGEARGYGGTWNNKLQFTWLGKPEETVAEIPFLSGGALAIKRDVFQEIGGFDKNFEVYGVEDQEISLKLWLFGYKVVINCSVEVEHLYKEKRCYEVTYLNVQYNFLCMVYSHFGYDNLVKAIRAAKELPSFDEAMAKVIVNDNIFKQRRDYFSRRKYDENYFIQKFNIQF